MKTKLNDLLILVSWLFAAVVLSTFAPVQAQTPNAWGYSTGYGNVYGSFGLASTMQSMYNVARAQALNRSSGRPAASSAGPAGQSAPPAPTKARNYGIFVPDRSVDTAKTFANALGSSPEERALIERICRTTKTEFEKEAATRGWRNNMAGGLTFFTVTAIVVYRDAEEPSKEAADSHFALMNATLDEIPALARISNKDKQGFKDMTVGFAGLLLAGYVEGKQNNDRATLDIYKKLAGMLIEIVLKTDPENLRMENGRIVFR